MTKYSYAFFGLLLALMFGVTFLVPVTAQERTGKQLAEQCKGSASERAACIAFLKQGIEKIGESDAFCLPVEFDPMQVRDAYIAWAADYPEELTKSALAALKASLIEQFPCEE